MGLMSKIAERIPRSLRLALLALPALWGFPSPPEPEVTAHTWRVPDNGADDPEPAKPVE